MAAGGAVAPGGRGGPGPRMPSTQSQRGRPGVARPGAMPSIGTQRTTAAAKALGAGKAPPRTQHAQRAAHAPARANPAKSLATFDPATQGILNPNQLATIGRNEANQQMRAELEPAERQVQKIEGAKAGAEYQMRNTSEATGNQIAQLGQQAQTSGQSYQNQIANAAIQNTKGIETTGQAMANEAGGQVGANLGKVLGEQKAHAEEAGAARNNEAAAINRNEENFFTNLRAAAALRTTENQARVGGAYNSLLGKEQANETNIRSKVAANANRKAGELGQKQFTDIITQEGLGIKRQGNQIKSEESVRKERENTAKVNEAAKANREKSVVTREGQREGNKVKLIGAEYNRMSAKEKNIYGRMNAQEKNKVDRENSSEKNATTLSVSKLRDETALKQAEMKAQKAGMSSSQEQKVIRELSQAFTRAGHYGANGRNAREVESKIAQGIKTKGLTVPAVGNATAIRAAVQMYLYHRIDPSVEYGLRSQGINLNGTQLAAILGA